jgi:hypothetical protein
MSIGNETASSTQGAADFGVAATPEGDGRSAHVDPITLVSQPIQSQQIGSHADVISPTVATTVAAATTSKLATSPCCQSGSRPPKTTLKDCA